MSFEWQKKCSTFIMGCFNVIRVQFKKIFNFMIDKKILILGSSGMIGSNLFKILFDKG